MTQLRKIAISTLAQAPENTRHIFSDADRGELARSIAEIGLTNPLVGYERRDKIFIFHGARRLNAIGLLVETGAWSPDIEIDVVVKSRRAAAEAVLASQTQTRSFHPAELARQIVKTLRADKKLSAQTLAARHCLTERQVRQLTRLGSLCPDVLSAWEDGLLTREMVEAFTLCQDHKRQRDVLAAVNRMSYASIWTIRKLCAEENLEPSSPIALFVGEEAYKAAGGTFLVDLFSANDATAAWVDKALAHKLASDMLEAARQDCLSEGWKFALSFPSHLFSAEVQAQEISFLDDDLPDPYDLDSYTSGLTDEEKEEATAEFNQIVAEAKTRSGVVLTLSNAGQLERHTYALRPEDAAQIEENRRAAAEAATKAAMVADTQADCDVARADNMAGTELEPEADDNPLPEPIEPVAPVTYSQVLRTDLSYERAQVLRMALVDSPWCAVDLFITHFLTKIVLRQGQHADAIGIDFRPFCSGNYFYYPSNYLEETPANKAWNNIMAELREEFFQLSQADLYDYIASQPASRKADLMAVAIAYTVRPQLADSASCNRAVEAAAAATGVDVRQWYIPSVKLFDRLQKGALAGIYEDMTGKPAGDMRKADLSVLLGDLFANPAAHDKAEVAARLNAWTPPAFAFPAPVAPVMPQIPTNVYALPAPADADETRVITGTSAEVIPLGSQDTPTSVGGVRDGGGDAEAAIPQAA